MANIYYDNDADPKLYGAAKWPSSATALRDTRMR